MILHLYLAYWIDRIYSFSPLDTSNDFFLTNFHFNKHMLIICDEFNFNDPKLNLNIFKLLTEGSILHIKQKHSNETIKQAINVPRIFITNESSIRGIDTQNINEKSDNVFLVGDDDYSRKGLRERLIFIHANKKVIESNRVKYQFTDENVTKTIKFVRPEYVNGFQKGIEIDDPQIAEFDLSQLEESNQQS